MLSPPSLTVLAGSAVAVVCISTSSDASPLFASAFSFSDVLSKRADGSSRWSRRVDRPIEELWLDSSSSSSTQLGLTTTTTTIVKEEDALEIYQKAEEFAFRDDFGDSDNEYNKHYHSLDDERKELEESKMWMREIINIESGCASGTLAGKDICDNQLRAAEIVARLRQKIEFHERRVASRTKATESPVPSIASELIVSALLVVLALFWTTLNLGQQHDDIPSMENYMQFKSVVEEKGYGWGR